MPDLGLFDVLGPKFLVGVRLPDAVHDVLAKLHVDQVETAWDESGVTVWGVARFDGDRSPSHTTPKGQVWDWHDVTLTFRLTAPRAGSTTIRDGIGLLANSDLSTLVDALGPAPGGGATGPSDYPGSQFRLEVLITAVSVHLPFLTGATVDPNGLMRPIEDKDKRDVKIVLPKILVAVSQGATIGDSVKFELESWGAEGLDDPADLAEGEFVEMIPSEALIGDSQVVGFGFRKAVLDLSDDHTPPDVMSQFGFGTDWQGVFLPEIRIYVAPGGAKGLAVDASAKDLMIGLNQTPGVSGDFELDVINQIQPDLTVGVRLYDASGKAYQWVPTGKDPADPTKETGRTTLPGTAEVVVDVQGAKPPYAITLNGTSIAATGHGSVTVPAAGTTIAIHAEDSSSPKKHYDLALAAELLAGGPQTAAQDSVVLTVITANPPEGYGMLLESQTKESATIAFGPANDLAATVDAAAAAVSGGHLTVPLAAGALNKVIKATWQRPAATRTTDVYFHFDEPSRGNAPDTTDTYILDPLRTSAVQEKEGWTPYIGSTDFGTFVADIPPNAAVPIDGYASFEVTNAVAQQAEYNRKLSGRRGLGLEKILRNQQGLPAGVTFPTTLHGSSDAETEQTQDPQGYVPEKWRRAHAQYTSQAQPDVVIEATLDRQPATPPPNNGARDIPHANTTPPFFRRISILVRIHQNTFIACEVKGEVDFQTAAEDKLQAAATTSNATLPGGEPTPGMSAGGPNAMHNIPAGNPNPEDGVVDFDLLVSHDDATGQWKEDLTIGAGSGDKDGLLRLGTPGQPGSTTYTDTSYWRDVAGLFAVLAPLLVRTAPAAAANGELTDIVLTAVELAIPFALPALDLVHTETWTFYGGELIARERAHGGDVTLLFDYETDLFIHLVIGGTPLITTPPDKPVKVRYKAVGFKLNFGDNPGQPTFQGVFDASRGYDIDVSGPGTFNIPGELGKILQVFGARIARTNPLTVEVDVGLKVDLGPISVDRLRVRMPVDPFGTPTITAIGVGVDITGTVKGRGYMELLAGGGIQGQIDITLVPLKVRIAAGIIINTVKDLASGRSATGVVVTLAVEFPTPIVLGASGLGIYGFLGLFAMHYHRAEDTSQLVPALDWFMNRANGDPTTIRSTPPPTWEPLLDHWSFGVGAVLGTVEGGFTINLKGMIALELPGPRILIFMNANIIKIKPETKGTESGTILAVLDLDLGRGTITIGLAISYKIEKILELHIPADAFFDFHHTDNFRLDVGTIAVPASALVLDAIRAQGYLEIHGNGIPDFPARAGGALVGFSIAAGVSVSIVWGGGALYLKLAGGFDVGVSFSPFHLGGALYFQGVLHLFIIDIEANGLLTVLAQPTYVHGQVCGKVDFFFFSVQGCLEMTLGGNPPDYPDAPPLVRGMYLQSRSPALVVGTGVDRPIDGSLGTYEDGKPLPIVPIDSIPVLQMEAPPVLDGSFTSFGTLTGSPAPGLTADGFFSRGKLQYRYLLKSVQITPALPTTNELPMVWRSRHAVPQGDDTAIDLALLDWIPDPTPKAVQRSAYLTERVQGRWGLICQPAAPAVSVLWSFQPSPLGPSDTGWELTGIPWPDPPDARRSSPPIVTLDVTEPWRALGLGSALLHIYPARVIGAQVQAPPTTHTTVAQPADYSHVAAGVRMTPSNGGASLLSRLFGRADVPAHLVETVDAMLTPPRARVAAPTNLTSRIRDHIGLTYGGPSGVTTLAKVLEAPFTFGRQVPRGEGNNPLAELSAHLLGKWAQPGQLGDALLFDAGPLQHIRFLVFVPDAVMSPPTLVMRPLDAAGNSLGDVLAATIITNPGQLPSSWLAVDGPWYSYLLLAAELYSALHGPQLGWHPVLIDVDLPIGTDRIELGIRNLDQLTATGKLSLPSYLVALVEGLTLAEVERAGHDSASQSGDVSTIDGVIASDPKNRTLLSPNQSYTVTVSYDWKARDEAGTIVKTGSQVSEQKFKTDAAAPAKLDPWVLAVNPTPDEGFHFYQDPVVVVFSTDDVMQLFAKYGTTLQATARAASYRPSAAVSIGTLESLPGTVLDPWEDTLGQVLGSNPDPCTAPYDLTRHGRATLDMQLDPQTPYVFDIDEPNPPAPPAGAPAVPRFRRAFTTSRYPDLEALAADVFSSGVTHRRIASGKTAFLAALSSTPTDVELEGALRQIGLGGLKPASSPSVTVIWEDGVNQSQPVAILIDAPEPLWRERLTPTAMPSPTDPEFYWDLQPATWLEIKEVTSNGNSVDRFVRSPGGARTVALLKGGCLGGKAQLVLHKNLNPLLDTETSHADAAIVDLTFTVAPWEYAD